MARTISGERRLLACTSRQLAETGDSSRIRRHRVSNVAGRVAGNYRLAAYAPQNQPLSIPFLPPTLPQYPIERVIQVRQRRAFD